jgi:hypothetical protein
MIPERISQSSVFIFFKAHVLELSLLLLFIVFAFRISRIGFNPTDDGLILAQSKRLLMGEVPHLDFLSPRPVGSPLLHTFEILIPLPQIYVSRILVVVELFAISLLTTELIFNQENFLKNTSLRALISFQIFLINMHNFPLMPWHTIDGIFFCLFATWLLTKNNLKYKTLALVSAGLIIGYVPLIKQSFAPILLVGALLIIFRKETLRLRIGAIAAIALPGFFYVLWLIQAGAFNVALDQMTSGTVPAISVVWENRSLFTNIFLSLAVLFSIATFALNNRCSLTESRVWRFSRLVLSFSLTAYASYVVIDGELALTNWANPLLVLACVAILLTITSERQLPVRQIVILSIAIMITLSWGYPNPNLLSGGLLVIIMYPFVASVITTTTQVSQSDSFKKLIGIVSPLVLVACSTAMWAWVESTRESSVYRDLPFSLQTESLSDISPELAGVRSNPQLAQYLGDVKNCIQNHSSENLAVLPDGAIVPFIFEKRNPLRIDWWTPSELVVEPLPLFLDDRLPKSYLILFQSFSMPSVAGSLSLPVATSPDLIFSYHENSMRKLFDEIPGETVYCGSLIGKYR